MSFEILHTKQLCQKPMAYLLLLLLSSAYYYRPQRSWAEVIFSQACVKNSVHRSEGVYSVHAGIHPREQTPPPSRHPPGADTPWEQTPLRTRHTHTPGPGTPCPPGSRHPPRPATPPGPGTPPGKQTAAYGQRAAGTHPTGMHSCFLCSVRGSRTKQTSKE